MPTPAVRRLKGGAAPSDGVLRLLAACLDIDSLWSLDHGGAAGSRLLAFADERTLKHLCASEQLHIPDVEFLVVVDGDAFASAWGPSRVSGSLVRWAWRQASGHEAYYDEARWSADSTSVVRIRRKAFLTWPANRRA
jgi:hypothetical protein